MLTVLRTPGPLRRLLLAHLQSSLGTAAGYIALLVLAYDRLRSPWAIALALELETWSPRTALRTAREAVRHHRAEGDAAAEPEPSKA